MYTDPYLPIITLSNGLRVANFNSAHPFNFEDGTVLEAVPESVCKNTMLDSEDVETFNGKYIEVEKKFIASDSFIARLEYVLKFKDWFDVCLVPLPALNIINEIKWIKNHKFRTIYVTDRITKAVSISKFCK